MPYYLAELTEKIIQEDRIQIVKASYAKLKVSFLLSVYMFLYPFDAIASGNEHLVGFFLRLMYSFVIVSRSSFRSVRQWSLFRMRSWRLLHEEVLVHLLIEGLSR